MTLHHAKLVKLLQTAYSAEKAASLAYIGHAASVKDSSMKKAIQQIEADEWEHRAEVLKIMQQYSIPISRWYEIKYYIIGKIIGASCFLIGRFMPYYFAGSLESGNVCEYFVMIKYFRSIGITAHDQVLYDMGVKEKEHEVFFLKTIENDGALRVFEKIFGWGKVKTKNNLDLSDLKPVDQSDVYCKLPE